MLPRNKFSSCSLFMDSWIYRVLPLKARISFLSRLSRQYLVVLHATPKELEEETIVGYESSWIGVSKK